MKEWGEREKRVPACLAGFSEDSRACTQCWCPAEGSTLVAPLGPGGGSWLGGGSGQVPGPEVDFWPIPTLLSLSQSSLGLATVVGVSDS